MPGAIEHRLTRLETIVEGLAVESERTRQRLHTVENDRQALRLATLQMSNARQDLTLIAESAVSKAFERRDSWLLRLRGLRVQVASLLVAAGSVVYALWR